MDTLDRDDNTFAHGRGKDEFSNVGFVANPAFLRSVPYSTLGTGLLGPIGDGQAVELFYNYQVKPWFHLTPDIQIIDPARESVDTSLTVGLRAKVDY